MITQHQEQFTFKTFFSVPNTLFYMYLCTRWTIVALVLS